MDGVTMLELLKNFGADAVLVAFIWRGGAVLGGLIRDVVVELRALRECVVRQGIHLVRLEARCHGKLIGEEDDADLAKQLDELRVELEALRKTP